MGSIFSCVKKPSPSANAKVVTFHGAMKVYNHSVRAATVLAAEPESCFLCDADDISFDSTVPMNPDDLIERGHLYFVLHVNSLSRPFSGAEMAALAAMARAVMPSRCSNIIAEAARAHSFTRVRLSTVHEIDDEE